MIFTETEKNDNCQGLTNPATPANYRLSADEDKIQTKPEGCRTISKYMQLEM